MTIEQTLTQIRASHGGAMTEAQLDLWKTLLAEDPEAFARMKAATKSIVRSKTEALTPLAQWITEQRAKLVESGKLSGSADKHAGSLRAKRKGNGRRLRDARPQETQVATSKTVAGKQLRDARPTALAK